VTKPSTTLPLPIAAEENLGAQMLRQAAEKTGEAVGDGTSTMGARARNICRRGSQHRRRRRRHGPQARGADRNLADRSREAMPTAFCSLGWTSANA
jgi:hypothetical protein